MGLIAAGNQINWGCAYEDERAPLIYKMETRHVMALVRVNNISFQNTFDIVIPSREKDVPDIQLIIPGGAYIYYIGVRLGKDLEQQTAGHGLKIAGAVNEGANNLIVSPSTQLVDEQASFIFQFPNTQLNPAVPQLGFKATPWIPRLYSTTIAGNALGGGIRSRNINGSFIGVEMCWYDIAEPLALENFLTGIPRS